MTGTSAMTIVVGIYLMWFQWGSMEKSQKTAQLMIDLVQAYGNIYGTTLAWVYVLIAPIAIVVAILVLAIEFHFWKKTQPKSH